MAALIVLLLVLAQPLAARTLNRYALLLDDPPASKSKSVVRIGMGPEVITATQTLRQKQTAVRAELARRNVRITGASQLLVNAIYVVAEPARVAELSRIPGVRRVAFLPPVRPTLDHAEQLVNTSGAWSLLGGMSNAGIGVKVAVIDSGIDQTHPAFLDSSLSPPPGFPLCQPEDCAFTSNKIIVARSYIRQQGAGSPGDPAADSRPDDFSPRDHQGHGTAVAMIIGGVTNTGPGDTITGFAPKAFLGSYKIFGTTGVNDGASEEVVILALEDAVKDGMDIANLSLGGPALNGALDSGAACGQAAGDPCDTLSQAVENASSLGMLVVVAAGNDGASGTSFPTLATVSTPAIAPSAIAVGATTNSHAWTFGANGWVSSEIPGFDQVAFFSSRGPAIGTAAIKPDIGAVGDRLFLTAQNYDPSGDLYNVLRYTVSQGTSFSSPMVAGAAALVKQRNPGWQSWQVKSALLTTATQDIMDRGQAAGVNAVGTGKLNAGNAVAANVTVNPQAASFGVVRSLPIVQAFTVQNNGTGPVNLQLTVNARTNDASAQVSLDHSTLTLAPGESAGFTASLTGNMPAAGSYDGFIVLQGDTVTLRIPYLYLVSDGVPDSIIRLLGDSTPIGLAGTDVPDGMLALEVIDRFGLPVPDVPVSFSVVLGNGQIAKSDAATNAFGIATAEAILDTARATNLYVGTAAGTRVQFAVSSVLQPVISDSGVVNGASFQTGPGIAPGSYISIFGANLSLGPQAATTTRLPLSIQSVSVSFDVPEANLSVPGHLTYVSSQQVNVQVPWELRGQRSVRIKVSLGAASGAVFTVPVADYSPGIFVAQGVAVAQDASFAAVTTANPATRGQTITLYGTGFGPVNHPPPSGDPAADASSTTTVTPAVTIGGVAAEVVFSGLAPGFPGLYQINVTIPPDAPPGMPALTITSNGIAANTALLPLQ